MHQHEWNVRVSVVELVTATTPTEARHDLRRRIAAAGFEPYDDDFDDFHDFHSETCPCEGDET